MKRPQKFLSLGLWVVLVGVSSATADAREAALLPIPIDSQFPFGCLPPAAPQLDPKVPVPADAVLTEQPEVNCFGWQEFIALNWKADPDRPGQVSKAASPANFGAPGQGPVVWETYRETSELFLPHGALPPPWGDPQDAPENAAAGRFQATPGVGYRVLRMNAKFGGDLESRQVLDDIGEAGLDPPAWLTGQNGKTVYYEIRVNEDYFNYIVDPVNRFYDARFQAAAAQPAGQGINFPVGLTNYGSTGAMELKVAWLEIEPARYDQFLTADAILCGPQEPAGCRAAKVGLVGLHIIHKTPTMPNWTWATFEHVQNAPDRVEAETGKLSPPYNFYRPDCTPKDAPQCIPNYRPKPGDPLDRPIQVVRTVPIPDYVEELNQAVHALIEKANPKSVFRHYRLVNVQWPQSGENFPAGGIVPLSQGAAAPTTGLSNITAETYVQSLHCLDCHQFAPIACSSASGPNPPQAGDYSFQLSRASEPHPPAFCTSDSDQP